MTIAKAKFIAILAGAIALSACGGGTQADSFTVSLESVDVVDQDNNAVIVNVAGITQSGSVDAK